MSTVRFSPAQSWMYVPISFLLGWLLLARIFIRGNEHWSRLGPLVERAFSQRAELIDDVVDLNHAARAYREYRDKQKQRLLAGEIDFATYETSLEEKRKALEELTQKRKIGERSPRDVALVFGPYPTAWENALHGAKWAAFFAAPWIVLALRDLLRQETRGDFFPLWWLARDILGMDLRDWRLLFEVHNLPAVGISISSIAVAIGAAITALLTSGATDMVTSALKLILPVVNRAP